MRVWSLTVLIVFGALHDARAEKFETRTVDFAVRFKGETSAYRDTSIFLMPGAKVTLEAVGGPPGDYGLVAANGVAVQQGARKWLFTAPERPGTYTLTLDGPGRKDSIALHVFVLVPAAAVRGGWLNGYRIGDYPPVRRGAAATYQPPSGFVEVTTENQDTRLSPHFTLKQFLCRQDTTHRFPKYLLVQERLLLKLEAILERVNAIGIATDTLHVMSGYRTPDYNHAIGDVRYSMHQWGGAADIYVDPRKNDHMADLNGDGRVDVEDARFLFDEIEKMLADKTYEKFQGGMGYYPATSAHPPFVHVDVRGTKARWRG